jgi:hypothetical protein
MQACSVVKEQEQGPCFRKKELIRNQGNSLSANNQKFTLPRCEWVPERVVHNSGVAFRSITNGSWVVLNVGI